MGIRFVAATPKPKKRNGHTQPKAPTSSLDGPGRQMMGNMLFIFNIAHSTFDSGVKMGRYPKPDGYDGHRPYWLNQTVREWLAESHGAKRPSRSRKQPIKSVALLSHQAQLLASLGKGHVSMTGTSNTASAAKS